VNVGANVNVERAAIVTGASRGIGRAIAQALAGEGYAILVNYRSNQAAAESVAHTISDSGGKAILCQGDIANRDHRQRIVDQALTAFGRIDMLVNNAGISPAKRKDILESDEDVYDAVMDTNLKAVYFMTQRAARAMVDLRRKNVIQRGYIVNLSSIRSYTTAGNYGEYCISKAGVSMITRLFAHRLAEYDIAVHEISPGIIATDMTSDEGVRRHYEAKMAGGMSPISRWGQPEEIGRVVAAIARGDFTFCTGQVFNIDGGWHLRSL